MCFDRWFVIGFKRGPDADISDAASPLAAEQGGSRVNALSWAVWPPEHSADKIDATIVEELTDPR